MKNFISTLMISSAVVVSSPVLAWSNSAKFENPMKIDLVVGDAKSYSKAQIKKAVIEGAKKREWAVGDNKDGSISARIQARKHTLEIKITYDTKSMTVTYVSSDGFDYEKKPDGTEVINKKYSEWVKNLAGDAMRVLP